MNEASIKIIVLIYNVVNYDKRFNKGAIRGLSLVKEIFLFFMIFSGFQS